MSGSQQLRSSLIEQECPLTLIAFFFGSSGKHEMSGENYKFFQLLCLPCFPRDFGAINTSDGSTLPKFEFPVFHEKTDNLNL